MLLPELEPVVTLPGRQTDAPSYATGRKIQVQVTGRLELLPGLRRFRHPADHQRPVPARRIQHACPSAATVAPSPATAQCLYVRALALCEQAARIIQAARSLTSPLQRPPVPTAPMASTATSPATKFSDSAADSPRQKPLCLGTTSREARRAAVRSSPSLGRCH